MSARFIVVSYDADQDQMFWEVVEDIDQDAAAGAVLAAHEQDRQGARAFTAAEIAEMAAAVATEPIRYVNAYAVDRCYGGPEEGGWYYDRGEPLASVPALTEAEVTTATERLRALFAPQYAGNRDRHSVLGGENLEIYTQRHTARPFPAERPHYE